MPAMAVIGAGFGDEGKGLMTDFFASTLGQEYVVVRFNGGAQAAHTVHTPDGQRHVFSHFGSGSFVGCSTHLSKFFLVNPVIFQSEFDELTPTIKISADPKCLVTTPYDMIINQALERKRSGNRHGSCGVGINETMVRSRVFPLTMGMLHDPDTLTKFLKNLRNYWVNKRLEDLDINPCELSKDQEFVLRSDITIARFLSEVEFLIENCEIVEDNCALKDKSIIFEGAQGLLLDQDHNYFPHVTHSHTGLTNIASLCEESKIDDLNVCYVTRCYVTRHGAGPLSYETDTKPYKGIIDLTNVPNEWQGSLRFGYLDVDLLSQTIHDDFKKFSSPHKTLTLAVTCIDQLPNEQVVYICDGTEIESSYHDLITVLKKKITSQILTVHGPTRNDVKMY